MIKFMLQKEKTHYGFIIFTYLAPYVVHFLQ